MRLRTALLLLTAFLVSSNNFARSSIEKLTTSINGTIINSEVNPSAMVSSENGKYWCTYEVLAATDEIRELSNLKLYENYNLTLTLAKIPGSDVESSRILSGAMSGLLPMSVRGLRSAQGQRSEILSN